ncbi:hypothetical protein BGZ63DRAFT_163300 [Mariannaea sp. PMI_226]|nr:hypothetical protein BGZ63DRAFT_163300 [Mariannaea sp. PMI_226]
MTEELPRNVSDAKVGVSWGNGTRCFCRQTSDGNRRKARALLGTSSVVRKSVDDHESERIALLESLSKWLDGRQGCKVPISPMALLECACQLTTIVWVCLSCFCLAFFFIAMVRSSPSRGGYNSSTHTAHLARQKKKKKKKKKTSIQGSCLILQTTE